MIEHPALAPYAERYATLKTEPLVIRLYLEQGSQLAGYDPLCLDNLLARCVVDQALGWERLPDLHDDGYALPVPLECLWRDEHGFPLWTATPFVPADGAQGDVAYWHKRQQSGRFTGTKRGTFSILSTKGRWMERRVPLPTVVAEYWSATCVGNAVEIANLLESLRYVGKRRATGFGAVEHWEIAPIEEFTLVRDDKLLRPLPMMAIGLLHPYVPEGAPAPVGWTPPQWLPALWAPGWWPGTAVTTDWLDAAGRLG
jgi:hypothetical protein